MPYKGGVQLLPETQRRPTFRSYTSGNSFFYFAIGFGVILLIVSAIFSSYKASLNEQIAKLDGQLQATEDGRDKTQEQTLLAASQQSALMRQLLTSKIYWSQALSSLQQMAQANVKLTAFTAQTAQGTIAIQGTADSYATVAHQLAAFINGTGITDTNIKSVKALSQGGVQFAAQLTIDPKVMLTKMTTK